MRRGEILNNAIFDYRSFFYYDDVDNYKKSITEFIGENENLTDDEFFAKFNDKFATVDTINKVLSRVYLQKIAANTRTIAVILIISLIASVIAVIAIASQLG